MNQLCVVEIHLDFIFIKELHPFVFHGVIRVRNDSDNEVKHNYDADVLLKDKLNPD